MAKLKSTTHVVVLHGWTLDPTVTDKWQPFLKLLESKGFVVHFWPLPGLAEIPRKPLTLDDYVTWLVSKTRVLDKFVLLGHSFGGQLAIRFAKLYPAKVIRLILVDNSGLIDTSLSKVVKRLVFKSVAKAGRAITGSTKLRQLLYRFSRETDYYEAAPTQRETMKNILAEEISADLPLVQAPTLVVWGENDQVTPLKFGRLVARTIPRANLKIISGARHSPVYTHEQKVVDLIEEFIKENKD